MRRLQPEKGRDPRLTDALRSQSDRWRSSRSARLRSSRRHKARASLSARNVANAKARSEVSDATNAIVGSAAVVAESGADVKRPLIVHAHRPIRPTAEPVVMAPPAIRVPQRMGSSSELAVSGRCCACREAATSPHRDEAELLTTSHQGGSRDTLCGCDCLPHRPVV